MWFLCKLSVELASRAFASAAHFVYPLKKVNSALSSYSALKCIRASVNSCIWRLLCNISIQNTFLLLNLFIVNLLPISSTGCFEVASQGGTLTLAVTFSWHLLWFEYLVGPTLSAFHCYSLSLSLPLLLSLSVFVSPAHTLLISLAKNAFPVKCKKEMMWCSPALTCNQSLPPSSSYFCYFTARHTAPSPHPSSPSRSNAVSAVLGGVIQSLTHASSPSPSLCFSCGGNVNENGFIKPGK